MYSEEIDSVSMNQPDINELSTITISGKNYIANLVWTPSASAHEADVSKNELCYQLNSNNFCRYKPNKYLVQYGVVASSDISCHGLPALAANIKHLDTISFCGIWKTDEGLWVILAFDDDQGVLVDAVLDSKEEARAELERTIIQHDYQTVYVPDDSWGSFATDPTYPQLEALLKPKPKCIVSNAKKRKLKNIFVILGIVLVSAAFFFAFQYWQEKKQEAEDRAAELSKVKKRPKIQIAPPPWINRPTQNEFVSRCFDELTKYELDTTLIPGWSEDTSSQRICNTTAVQYTIKRDGATGNWYDYMKQHIDIKDRPEMIKLSADKVQLKWSIEFSNEHPSKNMHSYNQVVAYLASEFDEMKKTPITFNNADTQSGYQGWQVYTFKFSLGKNPYLYLPLLNKVDNLTFTEMHYQKSTGTWEIQGALYDLIPQDQPVR